MGVSYCGLAGSGLDGALALVGLPGDLLGDNKWIPLLQGKPTAAATVGVSCSNYYLMNQ
jgi:hypothetical protein